jgi:Rrf2 family protein
MISHKAKYALKALVVLAKASREGRIVTASEIAETHRIPKKFLEQILLQLRHRGIVASQRGKAGGYLLGRRPEEVTFGEVLRLIDGPIAPLPCLSRIAYERCEDCADEASCEVRRVFSAVADATRDVLDRTTLSAAVRGSAEAILALQ